MNKKSYYYRNDDYKKIPINLQIDFSDHANMRLNQRELSKYEAKSAIEKGLSSICRLNHNDDFKLYYMKYFLVIPGKVYFYNNKNKVHIKVKTMFKSPKPLNNHLDEKVIYT